MYIETTLNDDQAEKLTYIQKETNQDISEVLAQALNLYYQQLQIQLQKAENSKKSPLEIFESVGLVGYIKDGDPDLSSNYKALVHEEIEAQHAKESGNDYC